MKRYRFSLEAVLRVRRAQEEAAGFALAHANHERRRTIVAYQAALARYEDVELNQGEQDHASFERERDNAERRAAAVAAALAAVDAASDAAAARQAEWSAAAQLVAALERLDERRRTEWRVEEQRAEMAAIDESAISGWLAESLAAGPSRHDIGISA
jgi:flagellar export protein FliJ